jgi:GT2 family glycosyltransferase
MKGMSLSGVCIQGEAPLVSIIILNYNGRRFLQACLSSVLKSSYPDFEVIFVDNGSTDGSVNFVKEKFGNDPRLRIVKNRENLGFAEGNNVGARYARGDFLVFLNNDTEVHPDWLRELVKTALSDKKVGIAICRILTPSSPKGLLVGNVDKYGNGVLMPLKNGAEDVEVIASGPAFLIKRHIWDEVGGFDSKYFIYVEDIDLAWRVKLLGYRIVPSFNSVVYHKAEGTTRRLDLARKRYFTYRNTIRTLLKNYSALTLLRVLPISLLQISIQSVVLTYMIKSPDVLLSLIRALLWNLVYLKDTWALHKRIQKNRILSDSEIQRLMAKSNLLVTYLKSRKVIL